MFKRITVLATLLAIVIGAAGLSAPAAAQDQVNLRLWAHQEGPFNDALQALIDAYTAEHPNVSIKMETFEYELYLQTLQTAMPAGDEADIIELFGSWTCSYADRLAAAPVEIDRSKFFEATFNGYVCDDQVVGLPFEFNLEYGTVLVNKTMFEDAGLPFPPQWKTWDELVSDAQKLVKIEDGQMTVAGYHFTNQDAIAFSFLAGILQRGGDYWNADHTGFVFDSEEAIATLQQMKDMVDAGVVDDPRGQASIHVIALAAQSLQLPPDVAPLHLQLADLGRNIQKPRGAGLDLRIARSLDDRATRTQLAGRVSRRAHAAHPSGRSAGGRLYPAVRRNRGRHQARQRPVPRGAKGSAVKLSSV